MPTAKLFVRGLSPEDESRLEHALRSIDGVHGAVASHAAQCCEVDFEDDRVGLPDLLAAARNAGYPARLAG